MSVSIIPFWGRIAALSLLLLAPAACKPSERPHDHAADGAAAQAQTWTCPMHPSYRSDGPGNCPICNMTLVPLEADDGAAGAATGAGDHAAFKLSPQRMQLIDVRTGVVEKKRVARTIHAVGRVEVDEHRLFAVNLRFAGWIEELFAKTVGQHVRKGEPLVAVYSPELYEAQRSLLAVENSLRDEDPTIASARERLLLLGLTEAQVAKLESQTEPDRRTPILAPRDGTILSRNVVEGGAIEPGKDLLELADLSSLWVVVDLYAAEASLVHPGAEAVLAITGVSDPGGVPRRGRVDFVYPTLNEAARTVRARIAVDNADGALKPGMYADATLEVDLGEVLVIDGDAVLDTGARRLVFVVPEEGRFEPREVKLGDRSDNHAVVLSGLSEGEKVVTSGNFLIDSESRLQAARRAPHTGSSAGHEHH
jgi:membrane fusion protein, copper/silver efflux system